MQHITKKSGYTLYVYYNDNGGTGSTSSSSCTISDTYNGATQGSSCSLSLRSNGFSRTGYSFGGWSTNKSATSGLSAGTSESLNSDATYYAIWKSTNNYNKLFERRFSLTYEMIDGIYTPTKVTIYDELTCMDDEAKYCKYTSLNGTSEVGTFSDLNTYDKDTVKEAYTKAVSTVDKAVTKGVMKKNTANNRNAIFGRADAVYRGR